MCVQQKHAHCHDFISVIHLARVPSDVAAYADWFKPQIPSSNAVALTRGRNLLGFGLPLLIGLNSLIEQTWLRKAKLLTRTSDLSITVEQICGSVRFTVVLRTIDFKPLRTAGCEYVLQVCVMEWYTFQSENNTRFNERPTKKDRNDFSIAHTKSSQI